MTLSELILLLFLLLGASIATLYLAVVVHEIGHLVAARLVGYRVSSLGLGLADPLCILPLPGNLRFYLCRNTPLQGLTWVLRPRWAVSRERDRVLLLGGVLANLAGVIVGLWLYFSPLPLTVRAIGAVSVAIHGFFAMVNLLPVPFRLGGATFRSDGAQLAGVLQSPFRHTVPSPHTLLASRPLWEAIGDTTILTYQLLNAALACIELGDNEAANRYIREAQTVATPDTEGQAYLRWVQGLQEPSPANIPDSLGTLWALTYRQDVPLSKRQQALNHPLVVQHPALYTDLLGTLISQTVQEGGVLEETLLARYEAGRSSARSDTTDAKTYAAIASAKERAGDTAGAGVAYERAITALFAVYRGLQSDPVLQARFAVRNQAVVATASACYRRLGRTAEAAHWEQQWRLRMQTASEDALSLTRLSVPEPGRHLPPL